MQAFPRLLPSRSGERLHCSWWSFGHPDFCRLIQDRTRNKSSSRTLFTLQQCLFKPCRSYPYVQNGRMLQLHLWWFHSHVVFIHPPIFVYHQGSPVTQTSCLVGWESMVTDDIASCRKCMMTVQSHAHLLLKSFRCSNSSGQHPELDWWRWSWLL